jgi:hypothetical protein
LLLPHPYDPQGTELALRARKARIVGDDLNFDPDFSDTVDKLKARVADRRATIIGTGEMTSYAAYDVTRAFAAMDENFYEGVAHRAGEEIHSLSELTAQLRDTPINLWGEATKSAVNNLTGHVGEAAVLHHLHDAGVPASWAEHSNQAGWDLNIEGHFVNVKTVSDASTLATHFSDYPDIPVVIPGDTAHIPGDAIHFDPMTGHGLDHLHDALAGSHEHLVLADDALHGADLHDSVQSAETLASGGHGAFGLHFPIVTLAISGWREFELLLGGKTDVGSALKSASLDIAGTGIGGAAGMKLGAIAGSFICPGVGTAIGGVVGAIAGAMTGRGLTNEIKQEPLRHALAIYQEKVVDLNAQARGAEQWAKSDIMAFRSAEQNRLNDYAAKETERVSQGCQALRVWNEYYQILQPDDAESILNCADHQLSNLRVNLNADYDRYSFCRKYLWPDIEILARQVARRFVNRMLRQIRKIRRTIETGQSVSRQEVFLLLGVAGIAQHQVENLLTRVDAEKRMRDEHFRDGVEHIVACLRAERLKSEEILKSRWADISEQVRRRLQPVVEALDAATNQVKKEEAKLGLS